MSCQGFLGERRDSSARTSTAVLHRSLRRRWPHRLGSRLFAAAAVAVFCLAACGFAHAAPLQSTAGSVSACPWLNGQLPIATRVSMLMRKITVAQEILLVEGHGVHPYVGTQPAIPSLCIPSLTLEDGPNGVGDGLTGVTALPAGTSLSASFSRSLAFDYGQVLGAEQAGKGTAVDLGPTVNIDRDPRWGREFESFSEDPEVAAQIGVAEIHGIQSTGTMAQVKHFDAYNQETYRNTPEDKVIVSERALHELYMPAFRAAIHQGKVGSIMCAYSTVNGEYSCQNPYLLTKVLRDEWNFDGFNTSDWGAVHSLSAAAAGTDMQEPEDTYFGAPLEKAVNDGTIARAVLNTMVERILYQMFRFNLLNHPPSGSISAVVTTPEHQAISTRVAETGAVLLKNADHLLPLSASATIAVIGPAASAEPIYAGGGSANVVPSSTITPLKGIQSVAGANGVTYTQGLPADAQLTPIPSASLSADGGQKGKSYWAKLTPPESGLYILGLNCRDDAKLSVDGTALLDAPGGVHSAAIELNKGQSYRVTSACSPDHLTWATPSTVDADLRQAAQAAKSARVAVVVVSDNTESEGYDRPNLRLPSAQNALVSAVAKANPHTIVVVQAGAPIAMPWLQQVSAVLDTWYPGQTNGTVVADLLFGKVDPSGHLPVSFPASLSDVPAASTTSFPGVDGKVHYAEGLLVGYRWYQAKHIKPMFPFGFGLSYTHFRYSDLQLDQHSVDGVTPIQVSARITNDGHVAGTDVAQLYLSLPASAGEPPRKLVDFHRVTLAPGESKVVRFTIAPRDEWWWGNHGWNETAGTYHVYVGDSSTLANLPLNSQYRMDRAIGDRQVTVTAPKAFQPGTSATVTVSLSAGGDEALQGVHLNLRAPGGWSVQPLGQPETSVVPGAAATARFEVTPPSSDVTQFVTLYGTADFSGSGCSGEHADAHCSPVRRDGGITVLLGS